jgi:hypothetical protein
MKKKANTGKGKMRPGMKSLSGRPGHNASIMGKGKGSGKGGGGKMC